ncbi:cysteine dioxygenase family protein [Achromobacter xylosoxidans]|uniref:cysteine dioxygenase family protein n=1 Tax=Alcaligenes xylosoxydans xylosoxydans TaxID=85698 RepID=UPI0022B93A5A|nr:cysteine dioxygenase family protein [Achromobacter xylosoxidans]MCZ8385284.1 cysteine dioxygenase family protein [Achromobacter xylosoxidans]
MPNLPLATADLRTLCESVQAAQMNAARAFLRELAASVANAGDMLRALPPDLRGGRPEHYTRHIAYADPHGAFTVAYLIWRPGQFSPVHGHKTWCTYQVLQGELVETHYRWDPAAGAARPCGQVSRRPGDIVTATQGLHQIHRLGNAGPGVAVSLHIYGVDQADLCTGVNHLVPTPAPH